jgi:hypothetical protein
MSAGSIPMFVGSLCVCVADVAGWFEVTHIIG